MTQLLLPYIYIIYIYVLLIIENGDVCLKILKYYYLNESRIYLLFSLQGGCTQFFYIFIYIYNYNLIKCMLPEKYRKKI